MSSFGGGMEFSLGQPIRLPPPPQQLPAHTILVRTPDRPEVITGQAVKRGQFIIQPMHSSEACYVSPITGTVRRVTPEPDGRYELEIEPPGETVPTSLEVGPPRGRKLDNWFAALRLVGPWSEPDGGVGLIRQLDAARNHEVDTLVCLGVDEFSPYPDRSSLLMSFPDDAVLGTVILADLLNVRQVVMLCARVPAMLGRLRASCRKYRLRTVSIVNRYPAAHPTMVVYASRDMGRTRFLPQAHNPVEAGVMMISPWTAIRVGRWFTLRRFDLVRPIFVAQPGAGEGARMSGHFVMPGAPLSTILPQAPYLGPMRGRVLAGDPMTGEPIGEPRVVPPDRTLVTLLPAAEAPQPEPCINCGWCQEVCPTQLDPVRMLEAATRRRDDAWLCEQLPWCIACGLCSYVCPSALPLAQTFRRVEREMAAPG